MTFRTNPVVLDVAHQADRIRINADVFLCVPFGKQIGEDAEKGIIFLFAEGAGGGGVQLLGYGALPLMTFGAFPKNRL